MAPITRTIRGVPSEVVLGIEEGLKETSAANFHALQTVAKDRIGRCVGSISVTRTRELREALLFALNLDEP